MSKRARFDGDVPTRVVWPAGEIYPEDEIIVEPGKFLPADVPASVRDELLARPDWSEVNQTTTPAKDKE
jgi:hypothetical protein